ncbi:aromatic amino acid beta-eliminating lyase/threonine aldolase [Gloeomargarita lithophora Alchichica-D10]|uniref:cysteine desulfurase n=1 Tax=Gloeomargarita lithophora Alchichica-D10 TaxID=1188229 RepID=A0A1J0AFK8_9CYAN|nr:aminotransferase class V-fold PLP-dependent enzyme [Gloeomargarita lithophora]APB34722.1 aromatic amino acid beta-eliminating lyase/threonine aldolase [Gloeomargarita lithophora Alchichica-D10]
MRPIYLDYHATTPLEERVWEAMMPYWREKFGNPASRGHYYGWEAQAAVELAREQVAASLNSTPESIIFTSGATEANNLAIKGVAAAYHAQGRHLVTVQTEHRAVLDTCRYLESLGFSVTYLPVQADGLLDVELLRQSLRPETILVSVMAANNEIGVLQPLAEIGAICRERGILLHTDAAQAAGKIPLDVQALPIDLLSLTAHKIGGPRGVGALFVRRDTPRVQLVPQLHGGAQEQGWRAGTLAVPLLVGLATALTLTLAEQEVEQARLLALRTDLWQELQKLDDVLLNGAWSPRLAGNLNVTFPGVNGAELHQHLQPVMAVSSGSACSTGQPSHVLQALGRSVQAAASSVRFGLGRGTTAGEIQQVVNHFQEILPLLRQKSYIRT